MKLIRVVFAVVLAVGVVGCGGDQCEECPPQDVGKPRAEGSGDKPVEQESLCPVDDYSCNPSEEEFPNDPPPLPILTRTLSLELWNATPYSRVCHFSYNYTAPDGSTVAAPILAATSVPADYHHPYSLKVPYGRTVTLSVSCWHPGYPEVDVRASNSLTTLPMDRARGCQAIYSETYGPQMAIPCWG